MFGGCSDVKEDRTRNSESAAGAAAAGPLVSGRSHLSTGKQEVSG